MSSTQAASIRRVVAGAVTEDSPDVLAVEEPLEIRLGIPGEGHRAISITMRTPGEDAELAAGFLFTEGILNSSDQIKEISHCGPGRRLRNAERGMRISVGGGAEVGPGRVGNTIRVDLNDGVDIDFKRLERHFYTTSSCGVCGKSSIEALHTGAGRLTDLDNPKVDSDLIHSLPGRLRSSQDVFDQTGGLHASALFTGDGAMEILREDVGRHNALDKVIGAKFLAGGLPLSNNVLLVSGRASFELVQKALMAGIPIMIAVGAPSSLACDLARDFGMTLAGFVRDDSFNVYTGASRII